MWKASWKSVAALALMAAAYCAAHAQAQAQADAKAAAVIANVRKALGGEQKIAVMKSLSLRADYRRELSAGAGGSMTIVMMGGGSANGSQQTNGKIEIDLALPDKYLRSDIGSAAFGMTRTEGFDATRPFLEVVPNSPGMRIQTDNPASDPARAKLALQRSHSDLARLLLGLTGGTQPGFTATYAYGGQAESPDGRADILDVTGPGDFKVRMYVDVETHLPLMLTYMEPEPRMVMRTMGREGGRGSSATPVAAPGVASHGSGAAPAGSPPSPGARQGGTPASAGLSPAEREELDKQIKDAEATPPKLVEYRLFFSDYRKVDGVSLPHRIARGVGAKTIEEWDITSYQVNPSFKADRFNVGR
jgi:hypothetical protein